MEFLRCLFKIITCYGPKKAPFVNCNPFFSAKSTGQYRPLDFLASRRPTLFKALATSYEQK